MKMNWLKLAVVLLLVSLGRANNPGGHMVQLSWSFTCPTGQSCSYNVYRAVGTVSNCGIGQSPMANTSGVVPQGFPLYPGDNLGFEDDTVVAATTYTYTVTELPKG